MRHACALSHQRDLPNKTVDVSIHPLSQPPQPLTHRCCEVTTIDGKCVLARGDTLAASLGFDHSGLGGVAGQYSWRRLRDAAYRQGLAARENQRSRLAAVGCPPGCALACLPGRPDSLRVALGSSEPARLRPRELQDAKEANCRRRRMRRVDGERHRVLYELRQSVCEEESGRGANDWRGVLRGPCRRCDGCPGYSLPPVSGLSNLFAFCFHCGSRADCHEAKKGGADVNAGDSLAQLSLGHESAGDDDGGRYDSWH